MQGGALYITGSNTSILLCRFLSNVARVSVPIFDRLHLIIVNAEWLLSSWFYRMAAQFTPRRQQKLQIQSLRTTKQLEVEEVRYIPI